MAERQEEMALNFAAAAVVPCRCPTKGGEVHVQQMICIHPGVQGGSNDMLVRCIEECLACAQACTSCADAFLAEEMVASNQELLRQMLQTCMMAGLWNMRRGM
jgi:hypothetical protein